MILILVGTDHGRRNKVLSAGANLFICYLFVYLIKNSILSKGLRSEPLQGPGFAHIWMNALGYYITGRPSKDLGLIYYPISVWSP